MLKNHNIMLFNNNDLKQLKTLKMSEVSVENQIKHFINGFPWIKIIAPATKEKGINTLSDNEKQRLISYYDKAKINGKTKFVPASGAASRMFKDMFNALSELEHGIKPEKNSPADVLISNIKHFAFYNENLFYSKSENPEYQINILSKLLTDKGLNYGSKPKGVLDFHRYSNGEVRTAIAEHLIEAQDYMRNTDGTAHLVITISPEHKELFESAINRVKSEFEKRYNVKYIINLTYQDSKTDTIAVDLDNKPFRTETGTLLFRPAGHGALIYNLNNIDDELVCIKNIDNVANERMLPITSEYKKVLLGKCLDIRDKIFYFLNELDRSNSLPSKENIDLYTEIESFLDKVLCIKLPPQTNLAVKADMLRKKLNRPIRVCGMVKNQGEPGGGPFIVMEKDGATGLQILESSQINSSEPEIMNILSKSTHFNPVDIVCYLKDYKGNKFNLIDFVDNEAGFISKKSYKGQTLKALELPGLWNGAMSNWNTVFVEVPLETFNPVKTVLDLLHSAHQ